MIIPAIIFSLFLSVFTFMAYQDLKEHKVYSICPILLYMLSVIIYICIFKSPFHNLDLITSMLILAAGVLVNYVFKVKIPYADVIGLASMTIFNPEIPLLSLILWMIFRNKITTAFYPYLYTSFWVILVMVILW